jgi:hypothetical protein
VTGYVIAAVAFVCPLVFGATGVGRSRAVLGAGAVLALVSFVALARQAESDDGGRILPLWLGAGLAGLLYVIWCGGLWLGLRLRRSRLS